MSKKKNHTYIFIGIVYKTNNVRNHCLMYLHKPLIDSGLFKSNLNTSINFGRKKVCICIHFKEADLYEFDYRFQYFNLEIFFCAIIFMPIQ